MRFSVIGFRSWCAVLPLLVATTGCGSHGGASREEGDEAAKGEAHVTVRTEAARTGTLTETVEGLGRCEALPDRIATLTPAVEGHVHELKVSQGDMVKKGQTIVELDKVVAQADLAEKTATRDGLRASLAVLKSLPRPEERRANELAVAAGQGGDRAGQIGRSRVSNRSTKKATWRPNSSSSMPGRRSRPAELQQETAEATLRAMMIGPRPEAVAEAEGKIKTADGLVAFSQAHLDYHAIRAPIDGVLDSLTCHPGQTIAIGSPIGEVVDTRQVFASVWLPTRAASSVRVGQAARVDPSDAHEPAPAASAPEEQGMVGKVGFLGRVADPQTGNLPVRILVDNPRGRLTLGQSVRVSIAVDERKNVLLVPAVAVLDLGEGPVLNVVRDGKSVVLHPEAGTPRGGWVAVAGTDLKEGEPVIVEGGYNLPEGTLVKLAEAKPGAEAKSGAEAKPDAEAKSGAEAEAR